MTQEKELRIGDVIHMSEENKTTAGELMDQIRVQSKLINRAAEYRENLYKEFWEWINKTYPETVDWDLRIDIEDKKLVLIRRK